MYFRIILTISILALSNIGQSAQRDETFDNILGTVLKALENIVYLELKKQDYLDSINISGCLPNCSLDREQSLGGKLTTVGFTMHDNSGRKMYTQNVVIENGRVSSGHYETALISPLSTAQYVFELHKSYLSNTYMVLQNDAYAMHNGCVAKILMTHGYPENHNAGKTNINVKCKP